MSWTGGLRTRTLDGGLERRDGAHFKDSFRDRNPGVGAVTDCMNGNVAGLRKRESMAPMPAFFSGVCVGSRSDNRESVVGRKWGCANL